MLIKNALYKKDVDSILCSQFIEWKNLQDKTVLITGATGLIGSLVTVTLLAANKRLGLNCHVVAAVRNKSKAEELFGESECLELYERDIREPIAYAKRRVDYIVHAASCTDSRSFVLCPVETIETTLKGTINVLEFAKLHSTIKTVFLSTMEVYGTPLNDERIDENHSTNLCTTDVRSCYPISKRMSEQLFASYSAEYGINGAALRLTQTFGPGVAYNDGRVFADFARCIIEQRDIVLHTEGLTKRMYLYTADAVSAILHIMLMQNDGSGSFDVFNTANESTYCSIKEMADEFRILGGKDIAVKIEIEDVSKYGYAPTLHMNLDTSKLKKTGWNPKYEFHYMITNLIEYMREIKSK